MVRIALARIFEDRIARIVDDINVAARAARHGVGAGAAVELVVAAAARKRVVPVQAVKLVGRRGAGQRVVARRAVDDRHVFCPFAVPGRAPPARLVGRAGSSAETISSASEMIFGFARCRRLGVYDSAQKRPFNRALYLDGRSELEPIPDLYARCAALYSVPSRGRSAGSLILPWAVFPSSFARAGRP